MSTATANAAVNDKNRRARLIRLIGIGALVVLVVAMALSTKIVSKGSELATGTKQFNAASYGKQHFPETQKYIGDHAVEASTLAGAVSKDPAAAGKQYGKSSDGGATYIIPVKFSGVVGQVPPDGYTPIKVDGLPADTKVGLQLGPAINGTELRDVTGKVSLNDFANQIQYQDAGAALNDELKKMLTGLNATKLAGKTVRVEGVFTLINPKQWNVTPARITVGQ